MSAQPRLERLEEEVPAAVAPARPAPLPVDIGHPLYLPQAAVALPGLLLGPTESKLVNDLPEADTHAQFPDRWWPYPVLAGRSSSRPHRPACGVQGPLRPHPARRRHRRSLRWTSRALERAG